MAGQPAGLETSRRTYSGGTVSDLGSDEPRVVLLVYHRDGAEALHLEHGIERIVGREPPADIAIAEPSLSRRHARFSLIDGVVVAEDLGSTNGIWCKGRRAERFELHPGDEVSLGAVIASVQLLSFSAERGSGGFGLERHDALRAAVDAELVRARYFGRKLSLAMVRGDDPIQRWAPRVQAKLRPVDRIALYGPDSVLLLLPEAGRDEALELIRSFTAGPLRSGVAVYPESATSAEELVEVSRRALRRASADDPVRVAPTEGSRALGASEDAEGVEPVVAVSEAMRSVVHTAKRLARGVIPVLLLGPTGSGKEVISRLIHESGPRQGRPMLCVNCAAIPQQLLESTLFGHDRGAFTGAVHQRKGVFEAAEGGTVLLDEIGDLPLAAQAALLRVLETKRVTRVGSNQELSVDVRILAATHRDLSAMCDAGTFRSDLYYRLNAMTLCLPPLRERSEDIEPLALRFLAQAAAANGTSVRTIDPDAMELLSGHSWPGNVRELRNAIERAAVIAEGETVTVEDLPEALRSPPAESVDLDFRGRMDQLESDLLRDALAASGWNQRAAALRLQMPLRTLVHKIKVHGIKRPSRPT